MKSAVSVLAFLLTMESFSQSDSVNAYRGITIFSEAGGASLGLTLNIDKVLFRIGNWRGAARVGLGRYNIENNRIRFRSVPVGINFFNRPIGHHHTEIGFHVSYVRGSSYDFKYIRRVVVSEALFFIPTLGYRFQKPGGSLFAKLQYSPFIKLKEFERELAYRRRHDEIVHFGGLSVGYFFGSRIMKHRTGSG